MFYRDSGMSLFGVRSFDTSEGVGVTRARAVKICQLAVASAGAAGAGAGATSAGRAKRVGAIHLSSALNSVSVGAQQVDTVGQIQGVLLAYQRILREANGALPDASVQNPD